MELSDHAFHQSFNSKDQKLREPVRKKIKIPQIDDLLKEADDELDRALDILTRPIERIPI